MSTQIEMTTPEWEPQDEIESLRQQLAENDAEIVRLSRLNSSYSNLTKAQEGQLTALRNRLYELRGADKTLDSERDANATLTDQLAANQLYAQQLREALRAIWDNPRGNEGEWAAIQEALALPADTTALSAIVTKAGEVMRERCVKHCDEAESQYFDGHEFRNVLPSDLCDAIRALPGVTLEDLKNG